MSKKKIEEITDMMTDKAFKELKKGQVLKFDYEGSITSLKITKIDRKNKRMWAEHINLIQESTAKTHYSHAVDVTPGFDTPFCTDCQVSVDHPSTEDGDVKAMNRRDRTLADGTPIE